MMGEWGLWLVGGFLLAVGAAVFTLLWWKVGDQWADAEYRRFGHGGGGPSSNSGETKVIRGFDVEDGDDRAAEKRA